MKRARDVLVKKVKVRFESIDQCQRELQILVLSTHLQNIRGMWIAYFRCKHSSAGSESSNLELRPQIVTRR